MRRMLCLFPLLMAATQQPIAMQCLQSAMVVKVVNRDKTADLLVEKLESLGGYFTALSEKELAGRIPPENLQTFLDFAEKQGVVIDRNLVSNDVTFEVTDLRAKLSAAESTMQEVTKLLAQLPSHALTEVRAEMARRIADIERMRGQLRLTEGNLKYAKVSIAFEFLQQGLPPPSTVSSFSWLNGLGVDQLMKAVGDVQ